jgi:hypothetical protein
MGAQGVIVQVFQYPYKYMYIYVCVCVCENIYYSRSKGQKKEGTEKRWGKQPKALGAAVGLSSVPRIGSRGLFFSQAIQNETSCRQDLLS